MVVTVYLRFLEISENLGFCFRILCNSRFVLSVYLWRINKTKKIKI